MAKPDNRADNVEHLQQALNHTMENIREAGTFLAAHADDMNPKDVAALEQKNERRRQAISGFREEIKDEAAHQRKQH
ncbi:small acid-soluble spore protein (thioredoxin-like protein) [Alicyclobacillus sacchari]|uniref:Small acid-soluble spore protein (Thioredoxin-like protein) n=1 Tax=Alicyclobacillus sacchari TaxID=392010 RepID=A0A4R8LUI9_9BACL|nr:small acid-soluble spore protein Tlp [Alicyclobacillus sacchari]TDY51334.1 small acid-soluble spore protein (thioredoxin-like protein) [Alicyclobacillus sacchari]